MTNLVQSGILLPLDEIDYYNDTMVECQMSLRHDKAELLADVANDESLIRAGTMRAEINEIQHRAHHAHCNPKTVTLCKYDLEAKIFACLRVQGWNPTVSRVQAKAIVHALYPALLPDGELDKDVVKSDLFDICTSFLNIISQIK